MVLPQLTQEQRSAALEKAAAVRHARAEFKAELKAGKVTIAEALDRAETDTAVGKLRVSALLQSLPRVGKIKAADAMDRLEIAPTRRVSGLGERQRKALIEQFS